MTKLKMGQFVPKTPRPIRIISHERVENMGSFEVRFADHRPSRFFYWDGEPSRRLRQEQMTREQALREAQAFALTSA